MMKRELVATNPAPNTKSELVITDKAWRPARSILAIANQKFAERDGSPLVPFEALEDIDDNVNAGLDESECRQLAEKTEELLGDPFALCEYGMTIDIVEGNAFYTYPTTMCTAYFEDVENEQFYSNLDEPGIVGRQVRSWFRLSEKEIKELINFMKSCGGFRIP